MIQTLNLPFVYFCVNYNGKMEISTVEPAADSDPESRQTHNLVVNEKLI